MSAPSARRSPETARRTGSIDRQTGEVRELRVCVGIPRLGHAGIGWLYAADPSGAIRRPRRAEQCSQA